MLFDLAVVAQKHRFPAADKYHAAFRERVAPTAGGEKPRAQGDRTRGQSDGRGAGGEIWRPSTR